MLNSEALEEFKEIWKSEFKEEISDENATAQAINLLTLMDVVYRPVKSIRVEKQK